MAGSLSLTPMQRIGPIDKDMFKNNNNAAKLDLVVGSNQSGGGAQRQNSLSKIAKFQPNQLKTFSSNIGKNIARNKQASQLRNEEASLVREKVQSMRAKNPFVEGKGGTKVNIST